MTKFSVLPKVKIYILPLKPIADHPFEGLAGATSGLCVSCGGPVGQHETVIVKPGRLYRFKTMPDGTRVCEPEPVEMPPVQEPLFILPGHARPKKWCIEYHWRPGEKNPTGEPKPSGWFHFSTYTELSQAKHDLRRRRYGDGMRKIWRMRVILVEHDGDIECTVPEAPAKPNCQAYSAFAPNLNDYIF